MGETVRVIIMAGGKGSRFGGPHKLVANVCGWRIIERMIRVASSIGRPVIAVSPHTRGYLAEICAEYICIETRGAGYPEDLSEALSKVGRPALILPGDTPFISMDILADFIRRAINAPEPVATLRVCRDSVCEAIGISFAKAGGWGWTNIDYRYSPELMDIDTREDLLRAEEICGSMVGGRELRRISA